MTSSDIFTQRQADFLLQAEVFQRRTRQLSTIRLAIFLTTIAAIWWLHPLYLMVAWGVGLLGIVLFAIVIKKHQKAVYERSLYRARAAINQEEIERLDLKFARQETGDAFASKNHQYANDLDIFGAHSLFRLLNRAHTLAGMKTLADWLLHPADPIEISVRQEATRELMPLINWRQAFEAIARVEKQIGEPTDFLELWLHAGENEAIRRWKKFRWLPILSVGSIITAFMGFIPWIVVVLLLLFHGFILSKLNASIKDYAEKSQGIVDTLKAFARILYTIENQPFMTDKLRHLQSQLKGPTTASTSIQQLADVTENLNFRLNPYFMLAIGLPTLWDLQWMTKLEAWKKTHKNDLNKWLKVLGEFEALSSLSGFAYANPTYPFAAITPDDFYFKAIQVGHPLIPAEKRICNSFELQKVGQTAIITGSNMSGKSTFLRTLGVNNVLALAGSVVCADSFSTSLVRLFTSMRTQDSLEENTSSFYAELKRLHSLLQLSAQPGPPIFYFLDEILKGTNSADRHRGAEALIRQLHLLNASGFVSTHDLELGQMETTHDFVHNFSFYSTFSEGKLHFDYRLQSGICREFNATALMRQIGIEMD